MEITGLEPAKACFLGKDMGKRTKIIQWAPPDGPKVLVMKPDGIDDGVGEAGIAEELGKVVQFETVRVRAGQFSGRDDCGELCAQVIYKIILIIFFKPDRYEINRCQYGHNRKIGLLQNEISSRVS